MYNIFFFLYNAVKEDIMVMSMFEPTLVTQFVVLRPFWVVLLAKKS